jgi:hypothetical protein
MSNGYIGKILRVNLTTKEITTIDSAKYEEFGGGYGMGTAIFWDLAVAPGQWDLKDPYDPRNVLPIMVYYTHCRTRQQSCPRLPRMAFRGCWIPIFWPGNPARAQRQLVLGGTRHFTE